MSSPDHKPCAVKYDNHYEHGSTYSTRELQIQDKTDKQQEVVQRRQEQLSGNRWHCSEYDF